MGSRYTLVLQSDIPPIVDRSLASKEWDSLHSPTTPATTAAETKAKKRSMPESTILAEPIVSDSCGLQARTELRSVATECI